MVARDLLEYVRVQPGVRPVEIAGSFRRCKETVGDLDVVVAASDGGGVGARLAAYPAVTRVLAHGATRTSAVLCSGLQVDLRVVPLHSFGVALLYPTGSKAHNIAVT